MTDEKQQEHKYEMSDSDKVRLLASKCELFQRQLELAELGRRHDALLVEIVTRDAESLIRDFYDVLAVLDKRTDELAATEGQMFDARERVSELEKEVAALKDRVPSGYPMFLDPAVHSNS